MERKIKEDPQMIRTKKEELRLKYEKHQLALEQTFEACSNLFFFFIDNESHGPNANTQNAVKDLKDDIASILERIITTPLVASACSNMFPVFIEATFNIISVLGSDFQIDFISNVLKFIGVQIQNLSLLLQTEDFDSIYDVEKAVENKNLSLDLCEINAQEDQLKIIQELKPEDLASVIFGKLAFYCEIIAKCDHDTKTKALNHKDFMPSVCSLFKVQAMINRYHACIYEKEIIKEQNRLSELMKSYQSQIDLIDFKNFIPYKNPVGDEELFKNLYFKYENEKVPSIADQKARECFKTTIELSLDENISHTSNMCQHAIRKMINGFLRFFNRQKNILFTNDQPIAVLEFNKMIGGLIAEEFQDFRKIESKIENSSQSEIMAMRYYCQLSAVFSEFNKVVFGNFSSGILMIEFIEKGGIECIFDIVRWIVKYLYTIEMNGKPKSLNQCKNMQLLWSHIIDFFVQLIEGKYLDQQQQSYLIAFKTNPAQGIKVSTSQGQEEQRQAQQRLKDYFIDIFIRTSEFLFVELNHSKYIKEILRPKIESLSVFEYFDYISEIFLVSLVDIYALICRGLNHVKMFNNNTQSLSGGKQEPLKEVESDDIDRDLLQNNLRKLTEMGFEEAKAKNALNISSNDLEIATNMLIHNEPELSQPLPAGSIWEKKPQQDDISQTRLSKGEEEHVPVFKQMISEPKSGRLDIFKLISLSFQDYLIFSPLSSGKLMKKTDVLDQIFFKLTTNSDGDAGSRIQAMLHDIKVQLFDSLTSAHRSCDLRNMGHLAACLTNILSYHHSQLVTSINDRKEVFLAVTQLIELCTLAIPKLKDEIGNDDESSQDIRREWGKEKQRGVNEKIKQIELVYQMYMYITEEGKISSDLGKLASIFNQKSAFDESFKDIENQLGSLNNRNQDNIFHQDKEQTAQVFQKITLNIIEIFKSLHSIDPQISSTCEANLHDLIYKGLEIINFLMNIKAFADFDCQACFLQNEGLRALFCIRMYSRDTIYFTPMSKESKKISEIQIQSKILMQMLCHNEHTQVKLYENLIKSVLFIFFQEQYKSKEQTNIEKEYHKLNSEASAHNIQPNQSKLSSLPATKNKGLSKGTFMTPTTPTKKYKTEDIGNTTSSKNLKQLQSNANWRSSLMKKVDYGEVLLDEFIAFFNNVMQIQDFRSFLQACTNVCFIKKKKKSEGDGSKFGEKCNQFMSMIDDAFKNPSPKPKEEEKKEDKKRENLSRAERAKRRREKKESKEETKDIAKETEDYYIVLNNHSMKDMLSQFEMNNFQQPGNNIKETAAEIEKQLKGHIQQFQQEIVFTLLDLFIEQIRDQQMLILQHSKQKINPSSFGIQSSLNTNGQLVIKNSPDESKSSNRLSYQYYLFDFTQILSHFTYMSTHSPILIRSLLKHKEGKTFKFIIRNLYFLMTMVVDDIKKVEAASSEVDKEYTVWFDHQTFYGSNKRRIDIVNEFFKRVMFDNPHLTANERKAKSEARIIFQKETLKNLCDHAGPNQSQGAQQKYPLWPQLKIIYNIGALWLLSIVLTQENLEKQQLHDKSIETVVASMQKYRNNFRNIMIKSLIHDCQLHFSKQLNLQGQLLTHSQSIDTVFALFSYIQLIQLDIQDNFKFFENQKDPLQIVIQALSNLLLPFDQDPVLWGPQSDTKHASAELGFLELGQSIASLSNVDNGQIQQTAALPIDAQPQIFEEMNDSEEDEEDEDEESSDSSDEDEDMEEDELLDSELSERNFRFSQHDMIEEEEEDEEEEDNGEDEEEYGDQPGRRNRHYHHHHGEEEEEDDHSDGSSGESFEDEEDSEEMQVIEDLLNRGPQNNEIDLIDYGNENEDGEDEEDDYHEFSGESGAEDQSEPFSEDRSRSNQISSQHLSAARLSQPGINQQRGEQIVAQQAEGDAEMNEEYGEEDDYDAEYDDEEEGEASIDDEEYYDEEDVDEDEDQEEVQIYVGRNPDQIDRLSHQELGSIRQAAIGAFRRDDMISMNNMSVDMLNVRHHQHHHDNMDDESADFYGDQNDQNVFFDPNQNTGAVGAEQPPLARDGSAAQRNDPVNIFDDLIGLILDNSGRQRDGGRAGTLISRQTSIEQAKDDPVYRPLQTMFDIVSLGKEMQRRQNIYTTFIREASDLQVSKNQGNSDIVAQAQNINALSTEKEVKSSQSQISAKNPFTAPPPQKTQSIFLQSNQAALPNLPFQTQPLQRQQPQFEEIELDPEFMENLDQAGLQNIAETENLMNRIFNQSNRQQLDNNVFTTVHLIQAVTNREERIRMFRNMSQEIFSQLPPNLQAEGINYRRQASNQEQNDPSSLVTNINLGGPLSFLQALRPLGPGQHEIRLRLGSGQGNAGQQLQLRNRLHSIDSQINDITDFSRQPNDPYVRNPNQYQQMSGNAFIQNASKIFQNMIAEKMNVDGNSIYINFIQYLQAYIEDMKLKPICDNKGTDITQSCQQIISSSLISSFQEVNPQNYKQITSIVEMIMVWANYLTNGIFIFQKEPQLADLIFRLPFIRMGFMVKTLQWMKQGIDKLREHDENQIELLKKTKVVVESQVKQFNVDRGCGLPGHFDIYNFILQCLRSIRQITNDQKKTLAMHGIEMLLIPSKDQNLITMIDLANAEVENQKVVLISNTSLLTQMIDWIVLFLSIISKKPGYMIGETFEDIDHHWGEILSLLSSVLKQLSVSQRVYLRQQSSTPEKKTNLHVDSEVIQKLCSLILSTEFKSKSTQKTIKNIFHDVSLLTSSGSDGQAMFDTLFKESLNHSLKRFIVLIEETKINLDELKKEVTVINQILKFSKSASTKSETNICDLDLFFAVVKSISDLIYKKNFEHITSSLQQAAFMFKEEFRTIMTTLFVLFEYNLKFIFTDSQQDDQQPPPQRNRRSNAAPNQPAAAAGNRRRSRQQQQQSSNTQISVKMEEVEEVKQEIAHETNVNSKDRQALIEAIDKHLESKIKDAKTREDQRLKVFIRFCLEHKKVINAFIRANQQVLNDSLRNVIIKVPQVLDFDNKRLLFRSQIKKIQKKYRLKYFDLQVRRDKVFDDSFEQLKHLPAERWKGKMNVEFEDEQGIDEGGLTREWFILLSQEILNPDRALFLQSNAGSTYYPNPISVVDPEYLSCFKFIGRIVGKALYEQQLLDCYFVKALYKIILGLPLNYHDVEDYDNEVYNNLKWCLTNSVENLGLAFIETTDYFGKTQEIELMEGGKDKDVTDENKYEYVLKMAYQKLYVSIKKQVDAFLQGFYDIVPKQLVQIFDNRELELLISGLPNIDIMDLKENTVYQNYTAETPVIRWLFEVLEEFDNSERAEFIQFVTGSSKVPVEGFKGLRGSRGLQKFQVVKFFTNDTNRLPQAHTCFKQLELPEYQSKEKLKERLLTAIKEGKTFGFA